VFSRNLQMRENDVYLVRLLPVNKRIAPR
jgi:hypothetical protein